jgi:DNA-binding transcriptional ArsR family regulator
MSIDRLSQSLAVLADLTQRAVFARLVLGETSITALAEPCSLGLPAISMHLKAPQIDVAIAPGGNRRTLAVMRKTP